MSSVLVSQHWSERKSCRKQIASERQTNEIMNYCFNVLKFMCIFAFLNLLVKNMAVVLGNQERAGISGTQHNCQNNID